MANPSVSKRVINKKTTARLANCNPSTTDPVCLLTGVSLLSNTQRVT